MYQYEVDIMALAETNINWGEIRRTETLPQVSRRWFQTSKTVLAYNQHQKRTKFKHQPGGTVIISKGAMALRVNSQKYDDKRLGRWSSQTFQGKKWNYYQNGFSLCPNRN